MARLYCRSIVNITLYSSVYLSILYPKAFNPVVFTILFWTGSGGPFLHKPLSEFSSITPDQACAHPNWDMGRKISVDSATMMNKGLELIEACWLFDVMPSDIDVVLHPQSIIHSMVRYQDGSGIGADG